MLTGLGFVGLELFRVFKVLDQGRRMCSSRPVGAFVISASKQEHLLAGESSDIQAIRQLCTCTNLRRQCTMRYFLIDCLFWGSPAVFRPQLSHIHSMQRPPFHNLTAEPKGPGVLSSNRNPEVPSSPLLLLQKARSIRSIQPRLSSYESMFLALTV